MVRLSVIIPTYNERENIPFLIKRIEKVLPRNIFEIIIVDDNSPDKTYEVVQDIASKKTWVRGIRRFNSFGLSSAIISGFSAAKGDYFLVMDADMQHDEKILPDFIKAFEDGSDIIVASRKSHGGKIEQWAAWRKLLSWIASKMATILLPIQVSDPLSGYFGIRRNVFNDLALRIKPRGFKILLEFLAHSKGYKISEIGYTFRPRQHGESKLSASVVYNYLRAIYDLSIGKFIPLEFIKYSIVGLSGVLVNQAGLWFYKEKMLFSDQVSLIIAIELSIISNFYINNYWTFKENKIRGGAKSIVIGLLKFNMICLIGALINYSTALYLTSKLYLSIYISNFWGILLATLWNYLINVNFTWKTLK